MTYLEEVNPLATTFKRDLETEFPDLTASFSGLKVEPKADRVPVSLLECLNHTSDRLNNFEQEDFSPESTAHMQTLEPRKSCLSMALNHAETSSHDFDPGFASHDSILSQEWLELPQERAPNGSVEGINSHVMDPFLSSAGDESWGELFRRVGGPGLL